MVSITITREDGEYKELSCIGHAGYANRGLDIVCAAASVLVINTINAIDQLTEDSLSDASDAATGMIHVTFEDDLSDRSVVLLDAMVMGLQEIERQYGRKYISVVVKQ